MLHICGKVTKRQTWVRPQTHTSLVLPSVLHRPSAQTFPATFPASWSHACSAISMAPFATAAIAEAESEGSVVPCRGACLKMSSSWKDSGDVLRRDSSA